MVAVSVREWMDTWWALIKIKGVDGVSAHSECDGVVVME